MASQWRMAVGLAIICLLSACAHQGYHYEGLTQVPNDPCQRSGMASEGVLSWLNKSVGKQDGLPQEAISISDLASPSPVNLASVGIRLPGDEKSLSCHAALSLSDGSSALGVFSMSDPGQYADIQVTWVSDTRIAAALAQRDGLRSGRQLQVKPNLDDSSMQSCVGREFALGRSEQFPGQLWAFCADPTNKAK